MEVNDFITNNTSTESINTKLTFISNSCSGCSITTICKLNSLASAAMSGLCPNDVNYLTAENLYKAYYGDSWKEEIKKVRFMSKYCGICNLVCYINNTARGIFKNTKYADSYLFYHDTLITMTDKDCIGQIEQEGILKRWVCPALGCNDEIVLCDENRDEKVNTRYCERSVENCMELMPLDNSLFRDTRTSLTLQLHTDNRQVIDDFKSVCLSQQKIIID